MVKLALYRMYLYLVCLVFVVFVAFMWYLVIAEALYIKALAPLASATTSSALDTRLRGDIANAIVALVVALGLGGLHYRLIRRDIQQHPEAATGLIRTFALNSVEFIAALIALFAGVHSFGILGASYTAAAADDLAPSLALTIVATVVLALMQVERGRSHPGGGLAIATQGVHLYLILSVALITGFGVWMQAAGHTIGIFAGTQTTDRLIGEWLGVVWAALIYVIYLRFARDDTNSLDRVLAQFFGFTFGLLLTIAGVWGAASLAFATLLGVPSSIVNARAPSASAMFIPALTFGVAAGLGYGFWLLGESQVREAQKKRPGAIDTRLTLLAIVSFCEGFAFYVSVILLAQTLLLQPPIVDPQEWDRVSWLGGWAVALGLLIAGAAYIPLAIRLRRQSLSLHNTTSREGFLLGGVAAGVLSAGIAITFVLIQVTNGALDIVTRIVSRVGGAIEKFWEYITRPENACPPSQVCQSPGSWLDPAAISLLVIVIVGAFVAITHYARARGEQLWPTDASPASTTQHTHWRGHQARRMLVSVQDILHDVDTGNTTERHAIGKLRDLIEAP